MPDSGEQPRTLHVISHTHWDREWRLSFQRFRFRLVQLVDRLMDLLNEDLGLRYFNMDAQTICVDDDLGVKPASRGRLLSVIRHGRILVAIWCNQNDNTLVSGESAIRSLLIGHRKAEAFGGPTAAVKAGCIPDQIGNISQLPQILRGSGIGTAVGGRGLDMPRESGCMEHWRENPGGSSEATEAGLDFPLGAVGRQEGEARPGTNGHFGEAYDESGNPITCHDMSSETAPDRVLSPTAPPMAQLLRRFTVQIQTACASTSFCATTPAPWRLPCFAAPTGPL
ncbi:MAG TPA: hypothetical protein VGM37_10875 [Armatimonadota bacterium]|jgi:hypothetical protein